MLSNLTFQPSLGVGSLIDVNQVDLVFFAHLRVLGSYSVSLEAVEK